MKLSMALLILVLLPAAPARGVELLTNGDFEQPLTNGWVEEIFGTGTVDRATGYHPDDDYEARVYKPSVTGHVRLSQTVPILGTDVAFSASARFSADATGDAWTAAALVIGYIDAAGETLGETCVCAKTRECPWEDSPTFHIIEAEADIWADHGFAIEDELANLTGVIPSEVDSLRISLLAQAYIC